MSSESKSIHQDLEQFLLTKAPPSIFYIPNFISDVEEKELLDKVYSAPKPKWTHLSHRRLQNWGGLPHPKGMVAEPLPIWLNNYAEKIFELGIFNKMPNHVLVNEYLPNQGIMPHEDGPLFYPVVATISLGSHTILDFFYHIEHKSTTSCEDKAEFSAARSETGMEEDGDSAKTKQPAEERHFTSVLLERKSLILVCDQMYKLHLHGIEERAEDILTTKVANLSSVPFSEGDKLQRETEELKTTEDLELLRSMAADRSLWKELTQTISEAAEVSQSVD